jgi:hypothetical protein
MHCRGPPKKRKKKAPTATTNTTIVVANPPASRMVFPHVEAVANATHQPKRRRNKKTVNTKIW